MKSMFFTLALIALTFSLNTMAEEPMADQELASDVELDATFEQNQKEQLEVDRQFLVQDSAKSQKELNSEKSRVVRLQAKNDRLNSDIKKHSKLAQERRNQVARETNQANRLEQQAAMKEERLEKIKIANVELRKSIEELRHRKMVAEQKIRLAEKRRLQAEAVNKALKEKRKSIKVSKSNRIRTAGL